jgi:hypothetical protein
MAPNGLFLPVFGENLQKISKLMLAGNATQTPNIFKKIYVSENQKFLTFRTAYNMLKESYSRAENVPKVLEEIER